MTTLAPPAPQLSSFFILEEIQFSQFLLSKPLLLLSEHLGSSVALC